MADPVPGAPPVVDQRTPPSGVLPRRVQTWLMVGLAIGILAIMVRDRCITPLSRPN